MSSSQKKDRTKEKTKGILLAAFGKPEYLYMAHNLAITPKEHSPNLRICILHDENISKLGARTFVFDDFVKLKEDQYKTNGKIDPARLKCQIGKLLFYDHNLYLDVDALAVQDLTEKFEDLIERPGYYYTHVVGSGKKDESIDYSIWATNKQFWRAFGLGADQIGVAIQSSYAYFEKCEASKAFYEAVYQNFLNFDAEENLSMTWGGTLPDELIYSGTIGQFKLDVDASSFI